MIYVKFCSHRFDTQVTETVLKMKGRADFKLGVEKDIQRL